MMPKMKAPKQQLIIYFIGGRREKILRKADTLGCQP
jgi:hypothetical protein